MARYDKYEPIAGGFRALLNAALTLTDGSIGPIAVSLNSSGRVVVGTAGQSGIAGVLVKNVAKGPTGQWNTALNGGTPNAFAPVGAQAGDVVDIMTSGEIVDLDVDDFPAGTLFHADPDGTISDTASEGSIPIGFTVAAGRLIVRVATGSSGSGASGITETELPDVPGSFADVAAVRTHLIALQAALVSSPYFAEEA